MTEVIKRNKQREAFCNSKLTSSIEKAFSDAKIVPTEENIQSIDKLVFDCRNSSPICTLEIQHRIEHLLSKINVNVLSEFIIYKYTHKQAAMLKDRLDYMNKYSDGATNAASASETDPNSNVASKNVANMEGEVYKKENRLIQRQRMKDELNKLYPSQNLGSSYIADLENSIIYAHDEATSPVCKPYCAAITLYPLMTEGVGNVDGITPSAPNDLQSFAGQVTNLIFLVSSQIRGAVAVGDYFITLNYYVIREFGENWYNRLEEEFDKNGNTVEHYIRKSMKQFIYGVNQPAGNRSYNSPFTNVSYYDRVYFESLFESYFYPDGTVPEWEAVDKLQRIFMQLHRELRLIKPLTFPVSTMAMVHNGKEFLDPEYKELCAEEWAKGGSFFCYNSVNANSLSSCCRVANKISENVFSSTTGMTGVMTGSCNVITLNLNRITQLYVRQSRNNTNALTLIDYLTTILERVYKYQIAYKTLLYEIEDKKLFTPSNGGYIYISKLYSTIGVIGYFEAAKFLGIETTNNDRYKRFLQTVFGCIKENNEKYSVYDSKRPFIFNTEAVPGENLAVRLYNADKADGFYVPEDQNLYNCYFYSPWDDTSVLDKLKLHGSDVCKYLGGGQACHINLDSHLTKEQYLKLLDIAMVNGTNYFTFNIPMSECADCGHVVNAPITECPICHGKHIKYWTRIIGYLTCVDNWSKDRQVEQKKRTYKNIIEN